MNDHAVTGRPLDAHAPVVSSNGPSIGPGVCLVAELAQLWQKRLFAKPADFPLGAGDVIVVSVPEIEELQSKRVRVSGSGSIGMPLLGTMQVSGLSEGELRDQIARRLTKYMKYPRVELFVERYQSREVAVIGAVQKAGIYDLAGPEDSLIDMLGRAGGLSSDAAQKVVFSFSNESPAGLTHDMARARSVAASAIPPADGAIIALNRPGSQACLGLPARPGDVLMVPTAGQVMVEGWVANPGAFKITPGMTILGAITAAGGTTFSWSAQLLRSGPNDQRIIEKFDLPKVEKGEQPDAMVQAGDVVVVEKSALGAVPYAFWEVLTHLSTGFAVPVP